MKTYVEVWASSKANSDFSVCDRWGCNIWDSTSDTNLVTLFGKGKTEINWLERNTLHGSGHVEYGGNTGNIPTNKGYEMYFWAVSLVIWHIFMTYFDASIVFLTEYEFKSMHWAKFVLSLIVTLALAVLNFPSDS